MRSDQLSYSAKNKKINTIFFIFLQNHYNYKIFIDILKIDIEDEEYKIIIPILENIHKLGVVICEFHRKSEYQKKL